MTKGVNPPMGKFIDAMTCPKIDVVEFSYLLDHSSQARCHLRLSPLIIDERWEQMPVHALRLNMHID
jgi:hypothetical protein